MIAKLRPGQEIEMELVCEKGIGKTNAKWSPVCTAYYRLLPDIRFEEDEEGLGPIEGKDAEELKKMCPAKVFDIEDIGGKGKFFIINLHFLVIILTLYLRISCNKKPESMHDVS